MPTFDEPPILVKRFLTLEAAEKEEREKAEAMAEQLRQVLTQGLACLFLAPSDIKQIIILNSSAVRLSFRPYFRHRSSTVVRLNSLVFSIYNSSDHLLYVKMNIIQLERQ